MTADRDRIMDEIERVLAADEGIHPSPRFAHDVIEAVHREAGAPAPLAFPWRTFLVGFGTCVALGTLSLVVISTRRIDLPLPDARELELAAFSFLNSGIGYAAAALAGSLIFARLVIKSATKGDHVSTF